MLDMPLEGRHELSQQSVDCRDINLWHSLDGCATEHEVSILIAAFVRALQPELVLETGAYIGSTSKMIGEALVENGHGRLVAIENATRRFRMLRRAVEGLPVTPLCQEAMSWQPIPGESIDFAFFDTDWKSRHREFDFFWPFMNRYTVVCWHDSGQHFKRSIFKTIQKLASRGVIQPIYLPTPRGVCFARVLQLP